MSTTDVPPTGAYDGTATSALSSREAIVEGESQDVGTEASALDSGESGRRVSVGLVARSPSEASDSESLGGAPDIQYWFDVLRTVVDQMVADGSTMAAAGVSARMRRIDKTFTPRIAGFNSFGDFVRAAEASGIVSASYPAQTGGVDILIAPTGPSLPSTSEATTRRLPRRMQPELWSAFTNWSPRSQVYWHKTKREVSTTADADAVPIPNISHSTQSRWMREFAHHQVGEVSDELKNALSEANSSSAFLRAVRSRQDLNKAWNAKFQDSVLSAIYEWAQLNSIDLDSLAKPISTTSPYDRAHPAFVRQVASSPRPASALGTTGHAAPVGGGQSESAYREQLLGIISRLPTHELLRLKIPLGYVIE